MLPDTAVKPGDTWTKDYDQANPSGGGSVHVTTKSTYVTDETVNGVKAAVVKTTSTAKFNLTVDFGALPTSGLTNPNEASPPPNAPTLPAAGPGTMTLGGTITSDITTWIDPGSHRILKSHMSAKDDMTLTLAGSPSSSYNSSMGPIAVKGTETMTLDPA